MTRQVGNLDTIDRRYDFALGVIGGTSDRMQRPRSLKRSTNLDAYPQRSMGSLRPGYREPQASPLSFEPTTLAKLVPTAGANQLIVHAKDGSGGGKLYAIQSGVPGSTLQTIPAGYTLTDHDMGNALLNGMVALTLQNDTQPPLMFSKYATGGQYATDLMKLTIPTDTCTAAAVTPTVSGTGVDAGYHWYRIRFRYRNGASKVGPVFPTGGVESGPGANPTFKQIHIANLILGTNNAAAKLKQDWVGWTIERTKLSTVTLAQFSGSLGSTAVPLVTAQWYKVADGTADTYEDVRADADLFENPSPSNLPGDLFGDPPHLEGLIAFKDRFIGWDSYNLYASQLVGDLFGTGPCNWNPLWQYPTEPDDGDTIQCVTRQADRLLVWKTNHIYVFEGDVTGAFRIFEIGNGHGIVGPRAATTVGNVAYGLSATGLVRVVGNTVEPWGEAQVGHYVREINQDFAHLAVAVNIRGEKLWINYPSFASQVNTEVIEYNFKLRQFRHHDDISIRDWLLQEDGTSDFGGYPLLYIDSASGSAASQSQQTASTANQPTFFSWYDVNGLGYSVVKAQKYDINGLPLWAAGGVTVGAPLAVPGSTFQTMTVDDGAGGCYVAFVDFEGGSNYRLVLQRLAFDGSLMFNAPSGITVLFGLSSVTGTPYMASDGAGGVVLVWDTGAFGLAAQRFSPLGVAMWTAGGVALTASSSNFVSRPTIDSAGYFYYVYRDIGTSHFFVMRRSLTDGSLAAGFAAGGTDVGVADFSGGATPNVLVLTSDGGALVPAGSGGTGIKIIKVSAAGAIVFTGGSLTGAVSTPTQGVICGDGSDGGYLAWHDLASTTKALYVSRFSAAGALVGSIATVDTWAGTKPSYPPMIQKDGAGGAIIVYEKNEPSPALSIWCVRYASALTVTFSTRVINAEGAGSTSHRQVVAYDGANGAWIAWWGADNAVRQQRIKGDGSILLGAGGATISTNPNSTGSQPSIAYTGARDADVPTAAAAAYRLWGFPDAGHQDRVLSDGTGGSDIVFSATTPFYDGGRPEQDAELRRVVLDADGAAADMTIIVHLETGDETVSRSVAIQLGLESSGAVWGDDSATIGGNDLVWASDDGTVGGEWASDETNFIPPAPLPAGTRGTSYAVEVTGTSSDPLTINGYSLDGTSEPRRPYGRAT